MSSQPLHSEAGLPLSPEWGVIAFAIGTLVLLVVGYDAYRHLLGG